VFQKSIYIYLKTEFNWEGKLEVNDIDWKNVWENVYNSLKAKLFQWQYMHNIHLQNID